MSAPVHYRQAAPGDLDFVVKSWISSFKSAHAAGILSISPLDVACPTCGAAVPHDFASVMDHTLRAVLKRPGVTVWVAYNPRAAPPSDLHGYLVSETGANLPSYRPPSFELVIVKATEPLIHYMFVKQAYRGFGIARALLDAAGIDPTKPLLYSCKTADASSLERAGKLPRAKWAPLSVRFQK
jgi:GNAT superfamily N-acetyltransferase